MLSLINSINAAVWGAPMLVLLAGTHIFLTVRTRGVQRKLGLALRLSVTREDGANGDMSQFGALATALAATVGTGNIIGVATAIRLGGYGAVLWCWLTGVLGMATKYGEGLLAVRYRRVTSDGTILGGPMLVLERGLNMRWLGCLFALFAMLCSFGIGSSVQANALTSALNGAYGAPTWVTALVTAALAAVVILGGVRSIERVCGVLVPFMAGLYALSCAVILVINHSFLLQSLVLMCKTAFSPSAIGGGAVGGGILIAMRYGVARGLFSNESGLGSAPIAASAARTSEPVRQALVSMTGTFWDTVVICAMTGLTLVSSMLRYPEIAGADAAAMARLAFERALPVGGTLLTVSLAAFVFSTIIGWSYYGERCAEHLFGKRAIVPYKVLYIATAFLGGVASLDLVWAMSDTLNFLMALPNLISLLLLSGVIARETRRYFGKMR
ncbi:MAG: alanine:cation symporter family protein [Oscillospiraceae bacterium]|jgi:AGCS family alanine or glycine:cation symporter|nr:alanine:cation symporter family protein [Oscillospiraceae bacterium]